MVLYINDWIPDMDHLDLKIEIYLTLNFRIRKKVVAIFYLRCIPPQ